MGLKAREVPKLKVYLDQLIYQFAPEQFPGDSPHVFVYFLTIENGSSNTIQLLGRKWILEYQDGSTRVIEGDGIVGKTPTLAPGESFSYNSFHLSDQNALAMGSFFGVDENQRPVFTRIPAMDLHLPPDLPKEELS
ncbi:MAG: ApaG domain [Verrucomicrobia bacterium]|nr:ApaG domain [Verrucomicrobiota bacterium]